jgi:hypothetical protein
MLGVHSCLLSEEGELLAFLAHWNSGAVAFSPDRDLQSVLSDHVAALSLNVKRGDRLLFWRVRTLGRLFSPRQGFTTCRR